MKKILSFFIATIGTLLLSVSIFAYDTTDIAFDIFYVNPDYPNQSTERFLIYDGMSPYSNDYINIADTTIVGYSLNNLVPYYADGDHVSVFVSFGIIIPSSNFGPLSSAYGDYSVYVSPNYGTDRITIGSLYGSALFDLRQYRQYQSAKVGGSCTWQGMSCEYKGLIYHGLSASLYGSASVDYDFFNINLQLDLNLTQVNELKPLNIFVGQKWVETATGHIPLLRIQSRPFLKLNDTSMYGLIEELKASIDALDFSALADLSQLSTVITNVYNEVVHQNELIEDLIDDTSPDPDITRFNDEANAFKSEASELHSIENELYGTIADFTFPAIQDQSLTSSMFTEWLQDNLILTLLVVSLAFILVFSFI